MRRRIHCVPVPAVPIPATFNQPEFGREREFATNQTIKIHKIPWADLREKRLSVNAGSKMECKGSGTVPGRLLHVFAVKMVVIPGQAEPQNGQVFVNLFAGG